MAPQRQAAACRPRREAPRAKPRSARCRRAWTLSVPSRAMSFASIAPGRTGRGADERRRDFLLMPVSASCTSRPPRRVPPSRFRPPRAEARGAGRRIARPIAPSLSAFPLRRSAGRANPRCAPPDSDWMTGSLTACGSRPRHPRVCGGVAIKGPSDRDAPANSCRDCRGLEPHAVSEPVIQSLMRAARLGIHAAGQRWKRKSRSATGRSDVRSRLPAPRAAAARRSRNATAARASAGSTSGVRSRASAWKLRRRSWRRSVRPEGARRDAGRAGRHGQPFPPRRQRADRGFARSASRSGGEPRAAVVAPSRRRRAHGHSPAGSPDFRRRRPARDAHRCAGFHGRRPARQELRRSPGDDGRSLPLRGPTHGRARPPHGRRRRRRLVAGVRNQRACTRRADALDRTRRPDAAATTSPSLSTSPRPSSARRILSPRPEKRELDRDGLAEMLTGWCARYPIVSIEDPFAEDDAEGFRRFTAALGDRVQVIGDDLLRHQRLPRRRSRSRRERQCGADQGQSGRHGRRGPAAALGEGIAHGFGTIVSARSARPKTFRSPISRDGAPGNSRSARSRDPSGWRNGTRCCASRKRWAQRRASPGSTGFPREGHKARPRRPEPPPFVWRHQASRSRALMPRSGTVKTINIISILTSLPRVTVQEFGSLLQSPWTAAIFTWRANPCPGPRIPCAFPARGEVMTSLANPALGKLLRTA